MYFLVTFNLFGGNEQRLVSANTWSSCLTYCEGTELNFQSITNVSTAIVAYNSPGTNCYRISGNYVDGTIFNGYVWETNFDSLTVWLDSQNFQSVNLVQLSNISYVTA
jgi:hypothetical protein